MKTKIGRQKMNDELIKKLQWILRAELLGKFVKTTVKKAILKIESQSKLIEELEAKIAALQKAQSNGGEK